MARSSEIKNDLYTLLRDFKNAGISKIHVICHSMRARVIFSASEDFHTIFTTKKENRDTIYVTLVNPEASLHDFRTKYFDQIRLYTPLVTIYGSSIDLALHSAEVFFVREPLLGRHIHRITRSSQNEKDDLESSSLHRILLDVDVVDTTALDTNIRLDRHSAFSLNKAIVNDLMDIVVFQHRATQRDHRLLCIGGNVFSFISAPSFVVQG